MTKKIVYSALFLATGIVLPLLTGQIKEIGDSLLPMHLVVLLCGYVCGFKYGFIVGLILPFIRSLIFEMPPIYPNAVWMSAELAVYGFMSGFLYNKFFRKQIWWLYLGLIISMISGRVVWGIAKTILLGLAGKKFTFYAFLTGGFIDAIPGIIIQLIFIPIFVTYLNKKELSE